MQTLYYNTKNYIRHTGNVIDLTEYRRRLAALERPDSPQAAAAEGSPLESHPRRSHQHRAWRSMVGELFSSAAVLLTTLLVTIQFL